MESFAAQVRGLLGLSLSPRQLEAFRTYEHELVEWNARTNLTAIRGAAEVRTKHFLDSLSCWSVMRQTPPRSLIDIGTGAGFPGLPLKILFPSMRVTLVDSVGKKVAFCEHMIQILHLEGAEAVQGRAEELAQRPEFRERYDWAVARAVAGLPTLAEYLLPFVRLGGAALAQKGESGPAEAQAALPAIALLGGSLRQVVDVQIPGLAEERCLVVIDKVAATPASYPRRAGVPAKRPLPVK
jgi:16S rRNA (guanine527-N7)-methyltransferase